MPCMEYESRVFKVGRLEEGAYFMAAATFAFEVTDLMLAEMVLTSRAGPLFLVRLLMDLHMYVQCNVFVGKVEQTAAVI